MTDDELYSTAIHESGHAVLAELLCMNPEYVTIEPTEATLGHLRRRNTCCLPLDTWRNLIVTCGGHVAEGLMAEDDYWNSYIALRWPYSDEEITDGARIRASLQKHSEDEQRRHEWFELALAQTRRILSNPAVRRSVESLAALLVEKRTVDEGEAAEVIDAALGRSKWNREQFEMAERYANPPQTWVDSREEYREMERALAAYAKKSKKGAK